MGVEGVHQQEGNLATVRSVQVLQASSARASSQLARTHLDLSNLQVEEGQAISNFNHTLGSNTTHGCAETTVQADDGELVQDLGVDAINLFVGKDVFGRGGVDSVPVAAKGVSVRCDAGVMGASPLPFRPLTAFHLEPFPARIG